MTVLLTVAYIFSFVDLYILALLVEPIKKSLSLSDTAIGLLLGPAFATLYAGLGLPLGLLADRGRRTWILGAGVALWSLATAACGLARSFGQLALARVGVGVGDAALAPCALSLISDSFPPERRGRPVAFYVGAQSAGAGIAALAGGSVMAWAQSRPSVSLPLLGDVAPWQFAFIAVGLPGLLIAMAVLLLREPARQELGGSAGIGATLAYLRRRWRAFATFFFVVCVMTIIAYSQNWFAAMFQRTWGWDITRFALWSGVALLVVGPLTVNAAGWACDRMVARGRADGPLAVVIAGTWLLVPASVAIPLMPSGDAAFGTWLLSMVGMSTVSAAAPIALLDVTPGEMRGQMTALFYMVIMLVGLVVGPLAVGLLTDNVFGADGIRYACMLVPLVFGLAGLALLGPLRREYGAEAARFRRDGA
jgi:MFS family permease